MLAQRVDAHGPDLARYTHSFRTSIAHHGGTGRAGIKTRGPADPPAGHLQAVKSEHRRREGFRLHLDEGEHAALAELRVDDGRAPRVVVVGQRRAERREELAEALGGNGVRRQVPHVELALLLRGEALGRQQQRRRRRLERGRAARRLERGLRRDAQRRGRRRRVASQRDAFFGGPRATTGARAPAAAAAAVLAAVPPARSRLLVRLADAASGGHPGGCPGGAAVLVARLCVAVSRRRGSPRAAPRGARVVGARAGAAPRPRRVVDWRGLGLGRGALVLAPRLVARLAAASSSSRRRG